MSSQAPETIPLPLGLKVTDWIQLSCDPSVMSLVGFSSTQLRNMGQPVPLTVVNGTIDIIPEPAGLLVWGACGVLLWRRGLGGADRRAVYRISVCHVLRRAAERAVGPASSVAILCLLLQ